MLCLAAGTLSTASSFVEFSNNPSLWHKLEEEQSVLLFQGNWIVASLTRPVFRGPSAL